MHVIAYNTSHFTHMSSWLSARNIPLWEETSVPKVGFISLKDEVPVAMGFLRLIEGRLGMIDGLLSNPAASGADRSNAIDLIVTQLIDVAKQMHLQGIISFSVDPNTLTRSHKFGFEEKKDQTIIILNLTHSNNCSKSNK
jgi:hypothetical protein